MQFRLYKMGIASKVAVANLTLINCTLTVILLSVDVNPFFTEDPWFVAGRVTLVAIAVLGFPLGWIAVLGLSTNGPSETVFTLLMILLPLNAYVWGYAVAAVVRCIRRPV